MCKALNTSYFPPESRKKHRRHITQVGFEPTTVAILEQMSYKLDHCNCPVARGSSNLTFSSGNRISITAAQVGHCGKSVLF